MNTTKRILNGVFAVILALGLGLSLGASAHAATAKVISGTINLNQASVEQLKILPGVGDVKASMIIQARTQKPFAKPEDVLAVKGIGEKTLAKWSPYISFQGETTLKEVSAAAQSAVPAVSKQ